MMFFSACPRRSDTSVIFPPLLRRLTRERVPERVEADAVQPDRDHQFLHQEPARATRLAEDQLMILVVGAEHELVIFLVHALLGQN